MVFPTHATVYHNTKQLGMVHLLNISTTYLDIVCWAESAWIGKSETKPWKNGNSHWYKIYQVMYHDPQGQTLS